MSSPNTHNQDQYPNALEVMRRISNATGREKSIFRGEPKIYPYPCSSPIFRQLKEENATKGSITNLLKQRQNKLIERIHRYTEDGNSDLERLMAFQHRVGKTNLIDFAGDKLIALFFACFWNDDEDGQIIVKRRDTFPQTIDELPDNEVVLLMPQKALLRAKDQRAVLIHAPVGFLPFETEESIVVKAEWKQEILEYLENEHDILYETVFDDMQGAVDEQNREDEQRVTMAFQSTTRIRGFAKPKDNKNIPTMEHYLRLLKGPVKGLYRELLSEHATTLITQLTKELKQNPLDAVIYFNRALVHHSKPDPNYGQAISDYGRALELNPSLVGVYNNRGATYASKPSPDYGLAMRDYDRAIKLKPDYAGAYSNRGILYAEKPQPDYAQAISDYTQAIELDPNFAMAYYNRGNAYAVKPDPDYEQAIVNYTRAIELNPIYAKAYNNRGSAYANKPSPDYTQAISDYNRAIELNPHNEDAYNNRGNAYRNKPNPDYAQAIYNYTRAIELNSHYAEAYSSRGSAYANKPSPDYAQAISDCACAIEINPGSAVAYNSRGSIYTKMPKPDYTRAESDFSRALELDPNNKSVLRNLKIVRREIKRERSLAKLKRLCKKTH